ncbi:GntP family permease [Aestuariicella hydrocarbonica]|uniref:GntP family permease n=1 Tax=Pseudomaricurvus hydrocarbonicus TaxID=1470433 RepID=A0A9E5JT42_9GAMM|nr:GntP family permease [Aestuariicella hydrocarbonica]NHO64375.1 GntP family permease [Aestuariicella hydrocarbonica]
MEYMGLLLGLALLIWLALKGVNIVFASLLCSLIIIVSNDLPLAAGLTEYYAFGPLGAFTFAGKFFLLFASGAIFGRLMGDSHAASSIAMALVRLWGAERALWISTLACAMLTYGGVVVFVVIFAMYPLGLRLLQEANVPKRLFVSALALGAGTFTLTALPGTPSINNVIPAVRLGTDLYAGGWLGLFGGAIMFFAGMWYLEKQRLRAKAAGEGFVPGPLDNIPQPGDEPQAQPHWWPALIPLLLVLLTILAPRLLGMVLGDSASDGQGVLYDLFRFASAQPILWPSIALIFGSCVAVLLFPSLRKQPLEAFGRGTHDSILPLFNTAAVIGFGGVVTHTAGFQQFTQLMTDSALPPMLSMFASISLVSGITGSSTGGLQIFMETMAPSYLAMGIDPSVMHRIVTMASGGFDSLPHCGAVVAMLTITGLTHREAYKDIAVITVLIPTIATLLTIGLSFLIA